MTLVHANTLEWIKHLKDNSISHIITDYEYGQEFPIEEFMRVCKGTIITFCRSQDNPLGKYWDDTAYWIKTPSTKNTTKGISHFVEEIHFHMGPKSVFNPDLHWSNYTGVYTDLVEDKGWLWKKPLSLMERLVRIFSLPSQLVLDPYMGSGTTLLACKKWDRRYVGVDKDIKWVEYCKEIGL